MSFNKVIRQRFSIIPSGFYALEDVERGQAVWRVLGGPAFLYAVLAMYVFGADPHAEVALRVAVAYNAMGVGWLYFISLSAISAHRRRLIVMFLDLGIWSVGFCLAGEIYSLIIWIPLTVSMGNGLRYSPRYGFIAAALSGVGVAIALLLSPFWRAMPLVSAGILLTVIVVPIYAFLLTKKIARNKAFMDQRAAVLEAALRQDALTGVLNRVGFTAALQQVFAHTGVSGHSGALLVIDLDGFKAVNDAAGHAAGDTVLRSVADAIRRCVRSSDSVGRLGGDEFAVALTLLHAPHDAVLISEKIIHAVAQLEVPGHSHLRIGASIGMCALPQPDIGSIDAALAAADALMYESKRAGKGRMTARAKAPAAHGAYCAPTNRQSV